MEPYLEKMDPKEGDEETAAAPADGDAPPPAPEAPAAESGDAMQTDA